MKVLHYIWTANIGGIERLVIDLAEAQKQQGIDTMIIVGKLIGDYQDQLVRRQIPHKCLELLSGIDISPFKIITFIQLMNRFDIVHLHVFHPAIMIAAGFSKTKIIYTIHGLSSANDGTFFRGKLKEFSKAYLYNKIVSFLTFNSTFTQKKATAQYGLQESKTGVVLNGIKIEKNNNSINEIEEIPLPQHFKKKFIIGTTTRFTPRKQLDRLINAFALFQKQNNSVLLMVGDGVERKHLEDLAYSLEIKNKVIFIGYTTQVSAYQKLIDVGVYPSVAEPFGLVALEFLKLGKPVLVFSDGGGLVEIINNIDKDDVVDSVDELASRLEFYYQNQSILTEKCTARVTYAEKYNITITADEFMTIYQDVLK